MHLNELRHDLLVYLKNEKTTLLVNGIEIWKRDSLELFAAWINNMQQKVLGNLVFSDFDFIDFERSFPDFHHFKVLHYLWVII